MNTNKKNQLKVIDPVAINNKLPISELEISRDIIESLFPPITKKHWRGLMSEISYYNSDGKELLYKLFWCAFSSINIHRDLTSDGDRWVAGEKPPDEAIYSVDIINDSYFDLKDIRISLTFSNSSYATVSGASSVSIGDLNYQSRAHHDFTVLAGNTPDVDVTFKLKVRGYIYPMRKEVQFTRYDTYHIV